MKSLLTPSLVALLVISIGVCALWRKNVADNIHWSHSGQTAAITDMSRRMISHDCEPEMEVWQRSPQSESVYLFREENDYCKENYEHVGWDVAPDRVVGTFRCDLDDSVAEYAVSVLREDSEIYGNSICQYVIIDRADDAGVGKNLPVRTEY